MRTLFAFLIGFYRTCISPFTPPACRFHPTCSEYAGEAVAVHGVLKGTLLAIWRILRCNPLCKGGIDPVPAPRSRQAVSDAGNHQSPGANQRAEPASFLRR